MSDSLPLALAGKTYAAASEPSPKMKSRRDCCTTTPPHPLVARLFRENLESSLVIHKPQQPSDKRPHKNPNHPPPPKGPTPPQALPPRADADTQESIQP